MRKKGVDTTGDKIFMLIMFAPFAMFITGIVGTVILAFLVRALSFPLALAISYGVTFIIIEYLVVIRWSGE